MAITLGPYGRLGAGENQVDELDHLRVTKAVKCAS